VITVPDLRWTRRDIKSVARAGAGIGQNSRSALAPAKLDDRGRQSHRRGVIIVFI